MTAIQNFQISATKKIIDDLHFLFQQIGSKETCPESEYNITDEVESFSAQKSFPFLNGVFTPEIGKKAVTKETVQKQINYFAEKKVSHIWWLVNETQKKEIGPLLESMGYSFGGPYLGYAQSSDAIDVDKLPQMPKNSKVRVYEVKTEEEYNQYCDTFSQIFGLDTDSTGVFKTLLKDYGKGRMFRHIYAKVDDKVVGVMTAMFKDGWCSVWNGGVLPGSRGQGVGRALCLDIFKMGQEENVQGYAGTLMADAMAKGLCHKFGGGQVSQVYPYIYGMKSEEFEPK